MSPERLGFGGAGIENGGRMADLQVLLDIIDMERSLVVVISIARWERLRQRTQRWRGEERRRRGLSGPSQKLAAVRPRFDPKNQVRVPITPALVRDPSCVALPWRVLPSKHIIIRRKKDAARSVARPIAGANVLVKATKAVLGHQARRLGPPGGTVGKADGTPGRRGQ
jgi:hypothetical protein